MIQIKNWNDFSNRRIVKEEFVGKFFRNISGKNRERIEDVISYVDFFIYLYNKKIREYYLLGEFKIDILRKKLISALNQVFENTTKTKSRSEEEKNFLKTFLELLPFDNQRGEIELSGSSRKEIDKILTEKLEFIRDYDEDTFKDFKRFLQYVERESRNFYYDSYVIKTERIAILEDFVAKNLRMVEEVDRIVRLIVSKDLYLYYSQLNIFEWSGSQNIDTKIIAKFVKSLILKIEKDNTGKNVDVCDSELRQYSSWAIGSSSTWSYDDELGVDYISKIDADILNKNLSDVKNFQILVEQTKEIDTQLSEFNKKHDNLSKEAERLLSFKEDKSTSARSHYEIIMTEVAWGKNTNDIYKNLINIYEKYKNLIKETYSYDQFTSYILSPRKPETFFQGLKVKRYSLKLSEEIRENDYISFISRFSPKILFEIQKKYADKKVNELLNAGGEEFKSLSVMIAEESDRTDTWYDGDKLKCGNILYHGSIHYNIDKPGEIEKLILKNSPYQLRYAGYGAYCATHPSAACQYTYLRASQGGIRIESKLPDNIKSQFTEPNSEYFPCIYRFTIKPGSKFEHKLDTSCDYDEFKNFQKMGIQGFHSGSQKVQGGETQETCIIDPECIIKIEKVKPSEILNIPDDEWDRGSKLGKKAFSEWYNEIIKQRKNNA